MAKKILSNIDVTSTITAAGDISTAGQLNVNASAGDEGGQIFLNKPVTNTALNTGVNIDVYQNKLRFWEAGGTNRGYYVDLTSGGAGAGTSLTGGSTGAMNYAQTEGTKQSAISAVGTTIVSVSITTNGYPILVSVTGDMENNSAGGWVVLQLYRGSTAIGNPVHAESSAGSENVPYALSFIDTPAAGTYTYALKINNAAGGSFNFGESDGPVITAIELSGPKGDTGSAGATYTLPTATSTALGGIKLFSDTAQSTAANSVTSTASRTYGLQVNASGQAVVNVPWTDTLETGQNYVVNSAFDIAQRGTSVSVSGGSGGSGTAYTLDQWVATSGGTTAPSVTQVTISQQASTANMISGYDFPYYANFATILQVSGTVINPSYLSQRIEDVRTLAGKQVTLSFWAKIASGTNSNFTPVIIQNFGTGGSSSVTNTGSAISLTTTWTRFSYTVTLGSMSGKTIGTNSYLDIRPLQLPAANFANLTVSIAGVKLEESSTATDFVRKHPSLATEQVDCQRYYWRFGGSGTTTQVSVANGAYYNTVTCYMSLRHPVNMRTAPSFSISDVTALTVYALAASKASTNITGGVVASKESIEVNITTAAITTNGAAAFIRFPANSTNYMEFSAEI